MTDITVEDLTNKETTTNVGSGVFDLISKTMKLHLKEEWDEGKITGNNYSEVWLGTMQSTLQQAIVFILNEQKAGKEADLIDSQIKESEERIDLIIAQTAEAYENITASQAKTTRENLLNSKQVLKVLAETKLVNLQAADQTYVTEFIRPAELAKIEAETLFIEAREAEQLAATIRNDAESTQKIALMAAQTLGFVSDTKQKVLKQMNDGYAVNLSLAGVGNVPEASRDAAIDQLTQELLDDVGTSVVIQSTTQVPDTGGDVPGDPATDP